MVGRGAEEPSKPSDLSEAERERLKRQYRGVFWDRKTKRWRCQLGYQSKKIFLGYFDDAGEAARAYDQKLVELRGAGARTNFPITEYLDMMPTPSKGRGGGGSGAAAAAAAAAAEAAAANREAMDADEEGEGEGEEFDQHEPGSTAAGGYADAETPSLDPARRSSAAGGRITGLLDLAPGNSSYAAAGGSESPGRHGLANLPAIAPLSTELPGGQAHAALEQQDYDMAGDDELAAAAQLALEIRRSFDGSNLNKWHQQHYSGQQHHPSVAHSSGSGGGGGSAAAAAATGYAGRSSELDGQQQQQSMGTYGNDTAAAAAAGYGGNASLYGSYGHHPHHHAAAAAHHHHQQQHYGQHHSHLRNGSTPGDLYGSSQGWADQAAAAAAGAGYDGHAAYGSSHYPHHHHHHHSHSGVAAHGVHGGFSDSGGGYAAGYHQHHHHAHYQQQQHARLQQQLMCQQQQQQAALYAGEGEDQHMAAAAAAGHLQHGQQQQQQQQHYHAGQHPHHQPQQQHGHYPLHHSHSYPGAAGHEAGMEGAAAAGYYGAPRTYATHAEAVAAQQARLSHAHSSGHLQTHHSAGLVPAHGVYGSSGDLQQHYGGGLAAAQQQQQQQPGQHQQEYDARAAASNPAVAAADYRQRLATYGLHGYASDAGEYGGGGLDAHMQQQYQHAEQQQQHMHAGLAGGPAAMDASGPGGAEDQYHTRHTAAAAAYETEDPWVQPRGAARGSAAGSDGGGLADGLAGGEGLAAIKTSRGGGGSGGRSSRAANRGAAAAAAVDSDDYDIEDDDDHGSDSDTGRGRGRKSKRGSRASAAAGGHGNGDGVLRTKQRTGDGGEDERGHSYRGVFWDKKSRRWRCQLGHKNKKIFLGYFGVAEDAARAYDQKLVELHGNSAKTNFPIADYLGGGAGGSGKHGGAAAVAESPRAPGAADVPGGRRRSSHAGDASAKGSQAQHSELSWGVLGLPRSARVSHDASEGAPRLSWAGADTLSSWDQQDPESQYASKRRRLMEGGGQLPTSPQEFGALTGSGLHGSHQAVGGEDMVSPTAMARQQSGGYRVVETPSVLPAGLTGRHSSSGHGSLPHPGAGSGFDAAALAAGILPEEQQQQQQQQASLYAAPAGGRSTLSLSRLASGEVGAVQALSGLCTLGAHADSAQAGMGAAAAAGNSVPRLSGAAAANAVLAAAGASPGAGLAAAAQQQQQQSQASRLFDEAVNQYGARTSAPGLPVSGPFAAAAVVASGRVSDANTGASSSTVTPPSTITAGGHFGGHSNASPQNAAQAAALSRLNSSEVRAVQALSGIHNDVLPYNSRTAGGHPATGFRQLAPQQQQQQQQQAPSPAAITETVAKELLCRASRVSAAAASSIAAVAAAAAAATAAKGSDGAAVMARSSADGSFSGLVGDMAATLGDGRLPAGAAAATPDALQTEQRLCTPRLSPLLTSSMLLPPPPPLQLQLEGAQDLGGDSLPGTATTAAAAAAAAAVAAGKPAGAGAEAAGAAAAAGKVLPHVDPGDAFAAEAGWGNSLEDLLMPKKRPSCSGNSGLIGLLGDIGQLKSEADAAAAAVVVVPEQQQQQQQEEGQDAAAAGDAAAAPAEQQAAAAADDATAEAPLATAAPSADAPAKAPAAATSAAADAAAAAQSSVPAAALPAAVSAALPDPAPSQSLSSASVAFITPQAEPMAVQP